MTALPTQQNKIETILINKHDGHFIQPRIIVLKLKLVAAQAMITKKNILDNDTLLVLVAAHDNSVDAIMQGACASRHAAMLSYRLKTPIQTKAEVALKATID